MRLITLFLLCLFSLSANAGSLFVDFMSAHKHQARYIGLVESFSLCDPDRALRRVIFEPLGVKFQGAAPIKYVYPDLVTFPISMLLIPNSAPLTSENDAGFLSVGAQYKLTSALHILPGIAVTDVGQMIDATPPQATVGIMLKFKKPALQAMDEMEQISGLQLKPRLTGPQNPPLNGVWFTVDADKHTAWCWRHLPLPY